ncbi:uncharacterized protein PV09_00310 [Verruconis gallopava]|uniref:Uncharacterized protein n=1 Tax=Verruconis gallopava TaxID=253628 RepID=A0A0D2BDB5_9PEZI|nr:uncharacterized protein PV09_00310 [Verruconis gallopava]KIW09424.1 hypothetical protein PV09_00310 [Verruconis gallopava]
MFAQQQPTRPHDDRSSSQPARLPESSATGQRLTRERSTSSSDVRDQYTKRSSIFSKRPKSILTTASHASSTRSHASSSSGSDISWRSSGADVSPARTEADGSKARFLFGRGRKSKPSVSKSIRTSSLLEADSDFDPRREDFENGKSTTTRGVRISAPFDFQHIAKIEGNPPAIHRSRISEEGPELFQNFRALPKGYRNAIIAPSPDDEEFAASAVEKQKRPPPLRPQRPDDLWGEDPVSAPLPHDFRRESHAYEDDYPDQPVSAPFPGYRSNSLSRRPAQRSVPSLSQVFIYGPGPEVDTETGMPSLEPLDEHEPFVPIYDSQPPGWIESSVPLLEGAPAMDPFPDHLRAPTFNLPLEQVPEEPEGTFSGRPSRELPRRPSLRHSKSSPAVGNRHNSVFDPFSEDEPPLPPLSKRLTRSLSRCSQSSDTLGDPLHSVWREVADPKPEQLPVDDLSWEDDIEYCYSHNAEADCDFNWQDVTHFDDRDSEAESWIEQQSYDSSLQPSRDDSQSMLSSTSHDFSLLSEKPRRVPSNSSVPELDYRYSHATSTASLSIATPRDGSLYRGSDNLPPLPVDIYTSKDMQLQHTEHDMTHSHDSAYNEIMIARNVGASVENLSHFEDDRPQTILFTGEKTSTGFYSALPTPPQSGREPAFNSTMRRPSNKSSENLIVNEASRLPLPKSPAPSSHDGDEAPQLVPRNLVAVQNAAKLRLLDAQDRLSNLPPTSMPRNMSSDSLDSGNQSTKLPTPPKSPLPAEIAYNRSFLATPSPSLVPQPSPTPATLRQPSPVNIASSTAYLPTAAGTTTEQQPRGLLRHRAESAAARIGALPSQSSAHVEKPGTPDSATSAPEGLGRKAYTLFPSHKSSNSDLRVPFPLANAPTSAPSIKSEPSTTRPPSSSPSQSSRSSSRPESRGLTKPKSKAKSKAPKKPNPYQERYPLGI